MKPSRVAAIEALIAAARKVWEESDETFPGSRQCAYPTLAHNALEQALQMLEDSEKCE